MNWTFHGGELAATTSALCSLCISPRLPDRQRFEIGNRAIFAAANCLYQRKGVVRCGPFAGYRATDFTTFYNREI